MPEKGFIRFSLCAPVHPRVLLCCGLAWLLFYLAGDVLESLSLKGLVISWQVPFLVLAAFGIWKTSDNLHPTTLLASQSIFSVLFVMACLPAVLAERKVSCVPVQAWAWGVVALTLMHGLFMQWNEGGLRMPRGDDAAGSKYVRTLALLSLLFLPFVLLVTASSGPSGGVLSMRFTVGEILLLPALIVLLPRIRSLRLNEIDALLAVMIVACLGSAAVHPALSTAIKAGQLIAGFAGPYVVFRCLSVDFKDRRWMRLCLCAAGGVAVVLALVQKVSETDLFFIRAGLPNCQVYGVLICTVFPFLLIELLQLCRGSRLLQWLVFGGLVTATATTLRDPGLLSVVVLEALAAGFFLFRNHRIAVSAAVAALAFLLVGLRGGDFWQPVRLVETQAITEAYQRGSSLASALPKDLLGFQTSSMQVAATTFLMPMRRKAPSLSDASEPEPMESRLRQRYAEWIASLELISAHPALGVGPGSYQRHVGTSYATLGKMNTSEPDMQNGWLCIGVTIGLVGMLALAGAIVVGIYGAAQCEGWKTGDTEWLSTSIAAGGVLLAGFWAPLLQAGTSVPLAVLLALSAGLRSEWDTPPISGSNPQFVPRALFFVPFLLALLVITLGGVRLQNNGAVHLWCEAESADSICAPMVMQQAAEASGGQLVEIPRGVGRGWLKEGGGQATYTFQTPHSGQYTLWARAKWTDGCGNSLNVTVNNAESRCLGNDAIFNEWHWVRLENVRLSAGAARFDVSNREDGVALDTLVLTNDESFRPEVAGDLSAEKLINFHCATATLSESTTVLQAGTADWSDYSVRLRAKEGATLRPVKVRIDKTYAASISAAITASGISVQTFADGKPAGADTLRCNLPAQCKEICLRLIGREFQASANGNYLGRLTLPEAAPLKGFVEIDPRGLSHIAVTGLRRFYDGFGGCDGNNDASWKPIRGKWKVITAHEEGLTDSYSQYSSEDGLVVAGDDAWANYDLRAMIRTDVNGGAGVVMNYRGELNYDLVRFAPKEATLTNKGRIEFVSVRNGKERIKSSGELKVPMGQWLLVEVRQEGEDCQVLVDERRVLSVRKQGATSGRIGLWSQKNSGVYFDNITVDFH